MRDGRADRGGGRLTSVGSPGFHIRPLRDGDLPALLPVEHHASALLDSCGLHEPLPPTSADDFAELLRTHTVLVAELGERPVGYVGGRDFGEVYWLREIGVDPDHGRRGIGRALVKAVADEARTLFHRAIGLTTYRDVPFNAPFYSRCGFLTVSQQPAGSIFEERLAAEMPPGASAASRTAMVKWL